MQLDHASSTNRTLTRRTTLVAMAGVIAAPLVGGGFVFAADSGDYATQTLKVGGLALASSKVAQSKGSSDAVTQFAKLEVGEQETIAKILAAHGFNPPPMTEDQKEKLAKLSALSGKDFDKAYVAAQIEGHEELLAIQKEKEAGDAKDPQVIVAKLAAQSVMSHIAHLKMLQAAL
jgi:putative membrane protein